MTPVPPGLPHPLVIGEIRDRVPQEQDGSQVAARDLARYYRILREALATLEFSRAQIMIVWHGLTTARLGDSPSLLAAIEAEEWRLRGMSDRLDVIAESFLAKVKALTPLQLLALIDGLERFNAINQRGSHARHEDVLRAVGFRLT